jgi:hypothetical protein
MALPLSGTITSQMILTELGYNSPIDRITCVVIRPGGQLKVMVNEVFINLNMCSPYLPTEIAPFITPSHWYGYNHNTSGIENITVNGNTTVDVGQIVTYTATLVGNNTNGVVLRWYKYEAGSWSDILATGSSLTITWVDPRNAEIKVVASGICNFSTVSKEVPISYNCVPVISGSPWVVGTKYVNVPFDIYAFTYTPSGAMLISSDILGRIFTWEVTGPVNIVGGQGTHKVVLKAIGTSLCNVRLTIVSCGNSYTTSWNDFTPVNTPDPKYYNMQQTRLVQKQCPNGQIGSYVTVVRASGTHSSNISVAEANNAAIGWLNGTDGQLAANNDTGGTCGNTPSWPNDATSQSFKKQCPEGQTGSNISYTVSGGSYRAATLAVANALAQADINANGQNNANTLGTCIVGGCEQIVNNITINLNNTPFVGYVTGSYNVTVSKAGMYNLTIRYWGFNPYKYTLAPTEMYLYAGLNIKTFSFPVTKVSTYDENNPTNCQIQIQVESSCSLFARESSKFSFRYAPIGENPPTTNINCVSALISNSGFRGSKIINNLCSGSRVYFKWRLHTKIGLELPWVEPSINYCEMGQEQIFNLDTRPVLYTSYDIALDFNSSNNPFTKIMEVFVTA